MPLKQQTLTSPAHARTGLAPEDVALWEVLLEECTSYQPQPAISKEDQQELVEEVSGELLQPGALDPGAEEGKQQVVPAGDAPAPRLTRIASGEVHSRGAPGGWVLGSQQGWLCSGDSSSGYFDELSVRDARSGKACAACVCCLWLRVPGLGSCSEGMSVLRMRCKPAQFKGVRSHAFLWQYASVILAASLIPAGCTSMPALPQS